jgi:hypothetical protein
MNKISYADQVTAGNASHPFHPVILSLPSFPSPFDSFIIHHGNDLTPVCGYQKTYRRLFGMIFFGASVGMQMTFLQRLPKGKTPKKVKKSKAKMKIVWSKTRFTCQNAPKMASFFCQ